MHYSRDGRFVRRLPPRQEGNHVIDAFPVMVFSLRDFYESRSMADIIAALWKNRKRRDVFMHMFKEFLIACCSLPTRADGLQWRSTGKGLK